MQGIFGERERTHNDCICTSHPSLFTTCTLNHECSACTQIQTSAFIYFLPPKTCRQGVPNSYFYPLWNPLTSTLEHFRVPVRINFLMQLFIKAKTLTDRKKAVYRPSLGRLRQTIYKRQLGLNLKCMCIMQDNLCHPHIFKYYCTKWYTIQCSNRGKIHILFVYKQGCPNGSAV